MTVATASINGDGIYVLDGGRGPTQVFDIETNGLLEHVTKLHSLVLKDHETGEVVSCCEPYHTTAKAYHPFSYGLDLLSKAGRLVGHNIIKYDIPVLEKLYPDWTYSGTLYDTLVATRLIWASIKQSDFGRVKRHQLPGKLIGAQSLEAWGYRLRRWKGDYAHDREQELKNQHAANGWDKPTQEEITAYVWGSWNQEMQDYCEQDVEVTDELFTRILNKQYSNKAIELEMATALVCAKIERNGFPFREDKAVGLYGKLAARRAHLEQDLIATFGSWVESKGTVTPKVSLAAQGYWGDRVVVDGLGHDVEHPGELLTPGGSLKASAKREGYRIEFRGYPFTKVEFVQFNPSSRDHVALCLKKLYGWEPEEFTKEGKPKIDDDILGALDYPTAPLLTTYFTVLKRIGQLAEGNQAWLKVCRNGSIFGSINPNGAVTGRATHSFPNVGQVPKVQMKKFPVDAVPDYAIPLPHTEKDGKVECILLDLEGGYGYECRQMFTVPVGWFQVGTDMSGLELRCLSHFMAKWDGGAYGDLVLNGDIHTANMIAAGLPSRDMAKTFIYAFLYGAGDAKIGSIVKGTSKDGKRLKANFQAEIPAIGNLSKAVKAKAKSGFIKGLDGRDLFIRSEHSALNTLLQSAGALLCKLWMVLLERKLIARGYKHGWDGDFAFMAWVHDELQIATRTKELADEIGQLSIEVAAEVGEYFNFRCPLTSDFKIGQNWAECH